jgi:transposase-like protein
VRSTDAEQGETELASYRTFADTDLLAEHMVASMLAGLSTRKYPAALEPVGEQTEQQASSTSKSAVSRQFVTATSERLAELHQRRLNGQRWPILFVDGFTFGEHQLVGALGVTAEGGKVPLGVVEGTTENGVVATRLLADLVDRGLDATHGILLVVDGSKALDKAIRSVFGEAAVVQRCRRHKERNVLDHLPESEHAWVRRKLRAAWMRESAEQAEAELEEIARSLQRKRPGAAASLREGLAETVTVNRLGVGGKLLQTVESTNPVESMIEIVAWHAQRVKRWRDGDMALRWAAAGMFAAESQFRRVKGYRELPQLIGALTDTVGAEPISPEVDGDLTATA